MKKYAEVNRIALLGTLILHVLLLIVFVSVRLVGEYKQRADMGFIVDMPEEREKWEEKKREEKKEMKRRAEEEVENLLKSVITNENIKVAEKHLNETSVREYEDRLKRELASYDYSRYAYKRDAEYAKDSMAYRKTERDMREADSLRTVVYSGKSSVAYDLEGRYAEFMPIPVFKCEFGGKVVVEIKVSRKGGVESAKVIDAFSDKDDCLRETAVRAALRSRFNTSPRAPESQVGKITYNFVKQ